MKLSVWQQFSSNHSGSFELVGRFASQEEAKAAYEKLYAFLQEFADWVNAYEGDIRQDGVHAEHTPPEEKFYRENEMEPYEKAAEWMVTISEDLGAGISQFDNLVIMQSVNDWANDGRPWDELLEKWGAKVFVGREGPGDMLSVTIRFTAKDEAQAERLHKELSRIHKMPPWAWYFEGKRQETIAYLDMNQGYELRFYQRDLPNHVKREGKTVIVDSVLFDSWTRGFPAVIAWLRAEGCEVEYKFLINYEEISD